MLDVASVFGSTYGALSIFFLIAISSLFIIPGLSVLVASYASFAGNISSLLFVIAIVFSASLVGDYSAYFLARMFSEKVRTHLKKRNWFLNHEEKARAVMRKYGSMAVFLSRFLIADSGVVVNYLSGFERMNARKFIIAIFFGELIYTTLYSLIGYIFKDTWTDLIHFIEYSFVAVALAVIAFYVVLRIVKYIRNKNAVTRI